MPTLPVDLEIDRLMNLIRGFGWEETNREVGPSVIVITIKKKIPTE